MGLLPMLNVEDEEAMEMRNRPRSEGICRGKGLVLQMTSWVSIQAVTAPMHAIDIIHGCLGE